MELPGKVCVSGVEWVVSSRDPAKELHPVDGSFDRYSPRIFVSSELRVRHQREHLFQELFLLSYDGGWAEIPHHTPPELQLEAIREVKAAFKVSLFLRILRDNPDVVEFLMSPEDSNEN